MKKIFIMLIMLVMVFSISACGKSNKKTGGLNGVTIGVVTYTNSGTAYESYVAFANQITDATGIKFKFVLGSSFDDTANLTAVQNLISAGADGIIMTMDSSMESIMREADSAHVYVAGFLNSMNQSLDSIKDDPYFLGTVSDGYLNGAAIGEKAAQLIINNGQKNVGVIGYPYNYFPNQAQADTAFRAKIADYNSTASTNDKITLYDTQHLSFQPLDPTYFETYPNIDAIFGMALTFIYPTMLSSNVQNVELYATGYDTSDSYTNGINNGSIGMMTCSNSEAMIYPVALLANAITGKQYSDKPASAEAVETNTVFLTSNDDLTAFKNNTIFPTSDASHSLLTNDDIRSFFIANNKDATYTNLVNTIQNWSMDDIAAKSN